MKIRITKTPEGEAPEHVRREWVGLELPVAPEFAGRGRFRGAGVLTGPKSAVGQWLAGQFGLLQEQVGYVVEASVAVELLADRAPEAADWWRQNASHMVAPGKYFLFAAESCEELPETGA